jgi:hypothetical protein
MFNARLFAVLASLTVVTGVLSGQEHPAHPDSSAEMSTMPGMMPGALGLPHTRLGSGTSWQPEASVHYGEHFMRGAWSIMLHGVAFGMYDDQRGPRGSDGVSTVDWEMLMAMHPLAGGMLHLHVMASAEPWTVGAQGYPLLLQSGEAFRGEPLHDRQHPHDLAMELAAMYERDVARDLALSLYAGPVGEPALGPVAYPHRMSAASDPFAPIGHHWQDATHITYGVITGGIFSRRWKLEGSIFNGREPDEHRTDFDLGRLDSYSGRVFFNPDARWSASVWYGYLRSPEALTPDESVHRYGASLLHVRPIRKRGSFSTALVVGANAHGGDSPTSTSALVEGDFTLDDITHVLLRAEYVQKTAGDLVVPDVLAERRLDVGELSIGFLRELVIGHWVSLGAGVRGSVNFVPRSIEPLYGSRTPLGYAIYLRLRPARMETAKGEMDMPGMEGMSHR